MDLVFGVRLGSAAFVPVRMTGLLLGIGLSLMVSAATAAPATDTPPSDPAGASAPAGTDAAKPAASDPVLGFRSALFGMSQPEVRKAIQKDFGIAPDAVKSDLNRAEKTHTMTVAVPELLPGGGKAAVSYVFGYKNDKLIQVAVTWSKATDPGLTPETLYVDAQQLQEYLLQAGYVPSTVTTNVPVAGGILMFHGADADGRETAMIMEGAVKAAGDAKRALTPTALNVIYKVEPKNLDVYHLPKGDF